MLAAGPSCASQRARTAFITYGSPLQRLYSRFFPAYFDAKVLSQIGEALTGTAGDQDPDRRRWPWRNLFRASDPIGGPVRHRYPADESLYNADVIAALASGRPPGNENDDVDRQFLDPSSTGPTAIRRTRRRWVIPGTSKIPTSPSVWAR
jgi:hypothetical protein